MLRFFVLLALLIPARVLAQDASQPATLHLNLSFEDLADAPAKDKTQATVTIGSKPKAESAKLSEGDNNLELSLPDGTHYLYIRCAGFAAQHVQVKVEDGGAFGFFFG